MVKEIDTIKRNKSIIVDVDIDNLGDIDQEGIVLVELLKGNNKVKLFMYESGVLFRADETKDSGFGFNLSGMKKGKHTVIVSVFDNWEDMNELCEPVYTNLRIK